MTKSVTQDDFPQAVLAAGGPVLVDFWAEWCGPCRMLAPVVDQLGAEFAGRAQVFKLNVDEHPDVPARFNVRSLPTLMLFRDGQPVAQTVGARPANELSRWLEDQIAQPSSPKA